MFKVLLVFKNDDLNPGFVNGVTQIEETDVVSLESGQQALELIGSNNFDLAVAAEKLPDMTGIEFIEKLVKVNPMVNTAVASDLPEKEFHEATEGLGVLMAVPLTAAEYDARRLIDYLNKIVNMNNV